MSAEILHAGDVLLVRWHAPQMADPRAIAEAAKARFEAIGKRCVYVSIAPAESPAPSDAICREMAARLSEMFAWCDTMHMVLEGSGVQQSMKRLAMASIALATGVSGPMLVHDGIDEMMEAVAPQERRKLLRALEVAGDNGMLGAVGPAPKLHAGRRVV
jgi:hypothetical protein